MTEQPANPTPNSNHPNRQPPDEPDFEQQLAEVENSLQQLKQRYTQIQQDRQQQTELLQRQEQLKKQLRHTKNLELKQELQRIQQQLETLELNLESSLFSWGSLKEPFWQAVRFAGAGLVIGWLLKSCVG